jgi:polysaccharide export outer membrane protein
MVNRLVCRVIAVALLGAGIGCFETIHAARQAGPAVRKKAAGPNPVGYSIAAGDTLEIYVVGVPELSRTYRVGPDGRIVLPMVSRPILASGSTPEELSERIRQVLRAEGLVTDANVLVTVESSPRNSVAVTGSIAKPGVYPVYGPTRLLEVLSQAGGLSPDAGSEAIVIRGHTPQPQADNSGSAEASESAAILHVPVRRLLATGDPSLNLEIFPGDSVDVPRAGIVYVVGAVNRAGGFELTGEQNHLTVLQAIALAGNTLRTAALKKAVIIQADPTAPGGKRQIAVDLKKILTNKAPDFELHPGDILFVPDSTGKQVLGHAVAAATTLVIYRVPF